MISFNKKYGLLQPINYAENRGKRKYVLCLCECGKLKEVRDDILKSGRTKSCGHLATSHNLTGSPEYRSWLKMKDRCKGYEEHHKKYYTDKGVKICSRWINSFENFLCDMGKKPSPAHTLDRFPNNKGGYEPNNCRWATKEQQVRNVTNNILITLNNETLILKDWCKRFNINYCHVSAEIKHLGLSFEDCLKKRNKVA